MIHRFIENQIAKAIKPGIVVELFGPRRAGKTFLLQTIFKHFPETKVKLVQGEDAIAKETLSSQDLKRLHSYVEGYQYLVIDEAQKIPNVGVNLKLLIDTLPHFSIFVTGSSSFDLQQKIGEPLVGRNDVFHLFPLSQLEFNENENVFEAKEKLEERLLFGGYPQVVLQKTKHDKIHQLELIRDGYLLKDILELDNVKNSIFIINLLRLLAFQIGNDISYSELAMSLNSNARTVMRYLDLLEKTFVVFSLPGYSRNLRKEYTKTPRFFFWDNGIRNAVISNFNPLDIRDDVGRLWENYCINERIKKTHYQRISCNKFFWRTYDLKEIDYLEEREGKLFGFEMKWKEKKSKIPKDFIQTYPGSEYKIVNNNNYLDFIS